MFNGSTKPTFQALQPLWKKYTNSFFAPNPSTSVLLCQGLSEFGLRQSYRISHRTYSPAIKDLSCEIYLDKKLEMQYDFVEWRVRKSA
jgi:hypothetical protein